MKTFAAIDADGFITALHTGAVASPSPTSEKGSVVEISAKQAEDVRAGIEAGKRVALAGKQVRLSDHPKAAATRESTQRLRRRQMIKINESSIESRGRVFKEFPHVHVAKQHKYIDIMVLFMLGRITTDDVILTRNLETGDYEEVTVGTVFDEIERSFHLRQKMRRHEQDYRDQINAIFRDETKTEEAKSSAIAAIEVPRYLDVDTTSDDKTLKTVSDNVERIKAKG